MTEFKDYQLEQVQQAEPIQQEAELPPQPDEDMDISPENKFYPPPSSREAEPAEIGIIREFNPIKVIEMERHYLRGEFWDETQRKYVRPKDVEPLMNEKGISKYISMITTPVCSLVTFGNYTYKEVNMLTQYFCRQSIPVLYINYKDYGIQKINLPTLTSHLLFWTFASLKKGLGAGDRNVIGRSIQESIVTRQGATMGEKKKSIWNKLSPLG